MSERALALILALLILSFPGAAAAAGLTDPMRPPAGYQSSRPAAKGGADKKGRLDLQSVLVSEVRRVAVIDGVALSPGEWHRGVQLVKVKPDAVVLKRRNGKRFELKLTSGIKKMSADMEKGPK